MSDTRVTRSTMAVRAPNTTGTRKIRIPGLDGIHHANPPEILVQNGSQQAVRAKLPASIPHPHRASPTPESASTVTLMPGSGDPRETKVSTHAAPDLPALLSVPHAATILGLSRASAYRYAAAGELPTKRLGGRVYVITAKIRPLLDGTEELAA
jgi:hypothetical protein